MKELTVSIADFQGPLDLMLHLIKEKKMDILNLDLQVVTKQYLEFIFQDGNINLEHISEYLPIAAYLLELQSKQLLPIPEPEEVDSNYEAEINRQKLINRILEYKKFKEITGYFQQQAQNRQKMFFKDASNLKEYFPEASKPSILAKNNINQLGQAMINLWKQLQKENKLPVNLNLNLISAEDRAVEIKKILKSNKEEYLSLESLFLVEDLSLHYFIITFIAILDLAKHQFLIIKQQNNFGQIMIKYKGATH
ncbi:segregation and condensation protein A [Spiroplasma platyhelix]|uniref:Segregation and condensation protein A n=1 Tax=Spiroplasma platyhelix PALS-1 TaxID=1276218 RepID=A0A846TS07_9MOLU|nr:segregation/condensation protein A [Spiroplasma platyhelix]MBE4703912.1 Segregation and condensation protein A [Spiroplasma platyhelix PALS-1]NKE38285.1 segregation/condensation protein A [Spiroplasma platyhelix PALS-1]UJB29170.1 segregation and condensation protein A [Spiroplasma platyhelix PALS-1]